VLFCSLIPRAEPNRIENGRVNIFLNHHRQADAIDRGLRTLPCPTWSARAPSCWVQKIAVPVSLVTGSRAGTPSYISKVSGSPSRSVLE
jgi:hypothetical protein